MEEDKEIAGTQPNAEEGQGADIPAAPAAGPSSPDGKHRLSVDNPKKYQFTGRATKDEAERIAEALEVRKPEGKTYDIVRLCLDMLDYIEDDYLQTFKTKKKR
jgi:hypothetical protein